MANVKLKNQADLLITLAEGETMVKTYQCLTDGYVCVSNKRVFMVEARSRRNNIRKSEVAIENVGGIGSKFYRTPIMARIVFGIAFLILAALIFAFAFCKDFDFKKWVLILLYICGGLCALTGIILLLIIRKRALMLNIYSKMPMSNTMQINTFTKLQEDVLEKWRMRPTNESISMISELGALIMDIQANGVDIAPKYFTKAEARLDKKERKQQQIRDQKISAKNAKNAEKATQKQAKAEEAQKLKEEKAAQKAQLVAQKQAEKQAAKEKAEQEKVAKKEENK